MSVGGNGSISHDVQFSPETALRWLVPVWDVKRFEVFCFLKTGGPA